MFNAYTIAVVGLILCPVSIFLYHWLFVAPHMKVLIERSIEMEVQIKGMLATDRATYSQLRESKTLLLNLTAETRRKTKKEIIPSLIYFIADRAKGEVKIGISKTPDKRLAGLQVGNGNDLEILVTVEGDESDEAYMHNRLQKYHKRGEWFYLSPEIESIIEELKRQQSC
jgi:hypothetical protein